MLIKLTRWIAAGVNTSTWINPEHVVRVEESGPGSYIALHGGDAINVEEKPAVVVDLINNQLWARERE